MTSLFVDLPLSWKRIPTQEPAFKTITLGRMRWLSLAEIPAHSDLSQSVLTHFRHGVLIRGCNRSVADKLRPFGFRSMYIGGEALLNLEQNPFSKKSLRELVRRGRRHGRIIEVPFNEENRLKIERLKTESPYGARPQLRHLFRSQFESGLRCFIFEHFDGDWLAAITLSDVHANKVQTELLLRSKHAPAGIMEALVQSVFDRLKKEQKKIWSLGEVPFLKDRAARSFKERMTGVAGRRFKFAYNYEGLFRFKNKFSPRWEPVYICANPGINYLSLVRLFIKSNFFKLIAAQMFRKKQTLIKV